MANSSICYVFSSVLCQRVQEISEQYSSYRSKSAENVAAAVKRKEDVSRAVNVAGVKMSC